MKTRFPAGLGVTRRLQPIGGVQSFLLLSDKSRAEIIRAGTYFFNTDFHNIVFISAMFVEICVFIATRWW